MAPSLAQIESEIDRFEAELIDLHEGIQECALIVDLVLSDDDTARSKSRRLKAIRRVTQRTKMMIALLDETLASLEERRALCLGAEVDG